MSRGCEKMISAIVMVVIMFVFCAGFALAYPLQGTQNQAIGTSFQIPSFNFNWTGDIVNALSSLFRGFINDIGSFFNGNISMNEIGKTVSNISIGNINNNGLTPGSLYQNFDNWLYGAARFHISSVFNAILSVILWLLNLAKDIVNWLLSLMH